MRYSLVFSFLIFSNHINALMKSVDESDDDVVAIMESVDGMPIECDSAARISPSDIMHSYYQPELVSHDEPLVRKLVSNTNLMALIIENYLETPGQPETVETRAQEELLILQSISDKSSSGLLKKLIGIVSPFQFNSSNK